MDRLAEIEGRGWYDQGPDDFKWLFDEVKRLRAVSREYIDTLRAQLREALGDDYEWYVAELEQTTTGTRKLADALKRLDAASKGDPMHA